MGGTTTIHAISTLPKITMRQSILILAKTGFIIRDLLLGRFAEELMHDFDLIAAVPNKNDKALIQFFDGKPVTLLQFLAARHPVGNIERYLGTQHWVYRLKQTQLNNSSMEINTLLLKSAYTPRQKALVNTMLLAGKMIKTLGFQDLAEDLVLAKFSNWEFTQHWLDVLKGLKPEFVVATMLTLPDGLFLPSADLPIVLAARKLGIRVGHLVQSWDNLSSKAYILPTWMDRHWTWSDAMSDDLVRFNPRINKKRIKMVGSPHYDFHRDSSILENRESYMETIGLDPGSPYIVIGTGTKNMFPDAPESIRGLVFKILQRLPGLQILIRIHPKDDLARWAPLVQELNTRRVVFQNPAPPISMDLGGFIEPKKFFFEQINTIKHAAVVVNVSSSLSVDAAILDCPVISLCYDKNPDPRFPEGRALSYNHSEHFKPIIESGGIWPVYSEEECIDAIRGCIENPGLRRNERARIAHMIGGPLDGQAGMRLAQDIREILAT